MKPPFPEEIAETCWHQLDSARQALHNCRNAQSSADYKTFRLEWGAFLRRTGSVIHALKAGCYASPQRKQWFGRFEKDARKDKFLLYMIQARGAEEHSGPSTSVAPDSLTFDGHGGTYQASGPGPMVHVGPEGVRLNRGMMRSVEGVSPTIRFDSEGPALQTVHNTLHGDSFDPPESFGGRRVHFRKPVEMGELYAAYLEEILKTAME